MHRRDHSRAKTNMTNSHYSGIGANPHFGTPGNPADRKRVPGGSSSGGAVAAADGMCEIAIVTDTGAPAGFQARFVKYRRFKPSRQRIPADGAFPCHTASIQLGRSLVPVTPAPRLMR